MWRRFGEATFALIAFVMFSAQTGGLLWVAWTFFIREERRGALGMRAVLIGSVSLAAFSVVVLTAWTLGYQWLSGRRERRRQRELHRLRTEWAAALYGRTRPGGPVEGLSAEALIGIREQLAGPGATRIDELLIERGVIRDLLRTAGQRRRRIGTRLDALDLVYRAGAPTGFEELDQLCRDQDPAVRALALRALSRAVGAIPDDASRIEAARRLAGQVDAIDVPQGAVDEALLNSGRALGPLVEALLRSESAPLIAAALEAAGRAHLLEVADHIPPFLEHRELEVRCAAWRALAGIGTCPPGATALVARALASSDESERSQAARFAHLLPVDDALSVLSIPLGDPSWWVRRSAAWALVRAGPKGRQLLRDAAGVHPDRFARHIAIEVLVDAGELSPDDAASLREKAA